MVDLGLLDVRLYLFGFWSLPLEHEVQHRPSAADSIHSLLRSV